MNKLVTSLVVVSVLSSVPAFAQQSEMVENESLRFTMPPDFRFAQHHELNVDFTTTTALKRKDGGTIEILSWPRWSEVSAKVCAENGASLASQWSSTLLANKANQEVSAKPFCDFAFDKKGTKFFVRVIAFKDRTIALKTIGKPMRVAFDVLTETIEPKRLNVMGLEVKIPSGFHFSKFMKEGIELKSTQGVVQFNKRHGPFWQPSVRSIYFGYLKNAGAKMSGAIRHAQGDYYSMTIDDTNHTNALFSNHSMIMVACAGNNAAAFCKEATTHLRSREALSLVKKRGERKSKLTRSIRVGSRPIKGAKGVKLVRYDSKVGKLAAYLAKKNAKAAVIWLGDPQLFSPSQLWATLDKKSDTSGWAFREKDITVMYPLLRGRSQNPGRVEHLYGEVDDVLSALAYLKKLKGIDPSQIYLVGHKSGATLALLAAAASHEFAGVVAFAAGTKTYDAASASFEYTAEELYFRTPKHHLSSIRTPTVLVSTKDALRDELELLMHVEQNTLLQMAPLDHADNMTALYPINALIADVILQSPASFYELKMSRVKAALSKRAP